MIYVTVEYSRHTRSWGSRVMTDAHDSAPVQLHHPVATQADCWHCLTAQYAGDRLRPLSKARFNRIAFQHLTHHLYRRGILFGLRWKQGGVSRDGLSRRAVRFIVADYRARWDRPLKPEIRAFVRGVLRGYDNGGE